MSRNVTNNVYILFHAKCMDGVASAWVVRRSQGGKCIPVSYEDPPPILPPDARVYLVDFSYPRDTMEDLIRRFKPHFLCIDHHKTAEQELVGLPKFFALFDKTRAACMMCWEFFNRDDSPPWFLQYIQDRDLWKWELSDSRAINARLRSIVDLSSEDAVDSFHRLASGGYADCDVFIDEGLAILDAQKQEVCAHAREAKLMLLGEYTVPVVNCTSSLITSDVGHVLCKNWPERPFSVVYRVEGTDIIYNLRSVGEFDVSSVARKYGGGGHRNAAGFVVKDGVMLLVGLLCV